MITDLWFVTTLSLEALATGVGLVDVEADAENHWEWVIGRCPEMNGVKLDLTRTHTVPAADTDTRIFLWEDDREMSAALVELVATRLRALGVATVHAGRWVYLRGNDFDRVVDRTFS